MPLGALDASVVVEIEILERVVAIVVPAGLAEKFFAAQAVVAVAVDAVEHGLAIWPLVARDDAVAVAIEPRKRRLVPVPEVTGRVRVVVGVFPRAVAPAADTELVTRQHVVAVPVVHAERLQRTAPFGALNDAVTVGVHVGEASVLRRNPERFRLLRNLRRGRRHRAEEKKCN
jgi:hypothetical protein